MVRSEDIAKIGRMHPVVSEDASMGTKDIRRIPGIGHNMDV